MTLQQIPRPQPLRVLPPSDDRLLELAEQDLVKALYNYRQTKLGVSRFASYCDMTDGQKAFYADAVRSAVARIWGGR